MFDTRFNNSFQNADPNSTYSQYQNMPYGSSDPYAAYNNIDPSMMNNIPYPTPPAQTAMPQPQNLNPVGYAKGGNVKSGRDNSSQVAKNPRAKNKPYHVLAEMIRQQGKGEDTILAHINPLEAMILKQMGGKGTINKETGLPQFGFFTNPGKATKSFFTKPKRALAETVGLASAIFGGPVGGAIGGAAKEAILGRPKNMLSGALSGGLQGAFLPGAANLAGSGLSKLGANSVGSALQSYGKANMGSWLGNMGQMGGGVSGLFDSVGNVFGGSNNAFGGNNIGDIMSKGNSASSLPQIFSANKSGSALQNYNRANGISGVSAGDDYEDEEDYGIKKRGKKSDANFLEKLMSNTGDYLSKPKNLLTAASTAASLLNRPKKEKPKTPEQFADEQKRLEKALMLTPAERAAREADLLAEAKMQRSIARNKFLPEERLGNLDPLYRKSHTPEEQKRLGSWFSYYNNPNFTGEPMPFKEGGMIERMMMNNSQPQRVFAPNKSTYIDGIGGGQDDDVRIELPDKSYIVEASTVSDLGDGNSRAGANVIDALISDGEYYISPSDVVKLGGEKKLDSLMKNVRKHKRGGRATLPPKAKPVSSYLK